MIIGTIDNVNDKNFEYHSTLREVLEYLRVTDFSKLEDGSYPFGDKGIVAKLQRYETRPITECKPESHAKYIDVQFVSAGEESLGWCPLSPELEILNEYDESNDVTFYKKLVPDSCVVLTSRSFAVLYPADVHRPCGLVDKLPYKVTKVVVKIPVELLQ